MQFLSNQRRSLIVLKPADQLSRFSRLHRNSGWSERLRAKVHFAPVANWLTSPVLTPTEESPDPGGRAERRLNLGDVRKLGAA